MSSSSGTTHAKTSVREFVTAHVNFRDAGDAHRSRKDLACLEIPSLADLKVVGTVTDVNSARGLPLRREGSE